METCANSNSCPTVIVTSGGFLTEGFKMFLKGKIEKKWTWSIYRLQKAIKEDLIKHTHFVIISHFHDSCLHVPWLSQDSDVSIISLAVVTHCFCPKTKLLSWNVFPWKLGGAVGVCNAIICCHFLLDAYWDCRMFGEYMQMKCLKQFPSSPTFTQGGLAFWGTYLCLLHFVAVSKGGHWAVQKGNISSSAK